MNRQLATVTSIAQNVKLDGIPPFLRSLVWPIRKSSTPSTYTFPPSWMIICPPYIVRLLSWHKDPDGLVQNVSLFTQWRLSEITDQLCLDNPCLQDDHADMKIWSKQWILCSIFNLMYRKIFTNSTARTSFSWCHRVWCPFVWRTENHSYISRLISRSRTHHRIDLILAVTILMLCKKEWPP